jgi:acyl-CoA thioester hydrolase
MSNWMYEVRMDVRDYELDSQAIVNNATYLNYFEHCRHMFMREIGLDFADLHHRGIDPVVVRIEVDYKQSLRSGDSFVVRLSVQPHGRLRYRFTQEIVRIADGAVMAQGVITAATLVSGRPGPAPEIQAAIDKLGKL